MLKCGEVSHEDKKFMEIVKRGTSKKDDHYVVPLTIHDSNLMLPNNRKRAIQRLMEQKKRFVKDNKFFRLSQVYGQSVKNFLCKKVRCIIIREDLVYPAPWSLLP